MMNKISRLIKRMTEEPFPTDGSLYDLGLEDGKLYQTEDGYIFHPVGDASILENGCSSNGVRSTTLAITTTKEIKTVSTSTDIFADIIGYGDIKKEFNKALESTNPIGILLCGPPGCGKSEFLKKIRAAYDDNSVFIDGSYGSKAGIFEALKERKPKYVLLDEIDKLNGQDQQALLNLMEGGRLTKTTKSESYDIKLDAWVFATANNKDDILEPLFDRFERYFLSNFSDDEFKAITVKRLKKEGIISEELSLFIASAVLKGLGMRSIRDAVRIARKCKTFEQVEETIQTLKKYGK
jgi:holliday junction DNA helicase RuvB